MSLKHWIILLTTAAMFGSSFMFINIAVVEIPPLTLAAARVGFAAIFMLVVLFARGQRLPSSLSEWWPLLVLGLFTAAIPYFAIAWGQTRITSSLGGILFATIPVFTIVVAPFVIQEERITGTKLLGAALGLTGVIMSVGIGPTQGLEDQLSGAFVTLIAAISYAVGNIYARTKSGISPMVMATGQLICGSLLLVPLSPLLEHPFQLAPSQSAIVSVLVIAVICTALPVLMMFWLVRNAGVSNTSNVAFFIPVAAVLLGAILLKEPISALSIAGFGFILVGALIGTGKLKGAGRYCQVV